MRAQLWLLAIALSGCTAPTRGSLIDDSGAAVDVSDLSRIVPTSVDVVEVLLALGHRDRIAAVPDWIDTDRSCVTPPDGVQGIPQIGRPHVISAEEVLAQRPTLVIEKDHPLQPTTLATQLRNARVPVYVLRNDETVDNVRHTFESIGRILENVDPGAPERAARLAHEFEEDVGNVSRRVHESGEPHYRALYQFPAGLVAARKTTGGLLLELAGASDIAGGLGLEGYKQMAPESVANADPERVVVSCTAAGSAEAVYGAPKFQHTTAARFSPESLRIVDPSTTGLIGPRFVQGLAEVASWLHPSGFGLIQANATWNQTGRSIEVAAANLYVRDGPATYRLDPGDGAAASSELRHTYGAAGSYMARFQVIDAHGRIHEQRRTFEVP